MNNKKTKILFLVIFFFGIFGMAKNSQARELYVSPTGSGSAYTLASPGDAKSALSLAVAGDTVMFLDGRYTAADDEGHTGDHAYVAFTPEHSGTDGNPITLKSVNLHGAVFVRRTPGTPALGIFSQSYIVVDGVKTEGSLLSSFGHHVTIKNCEVTVGSMISWDSSQEASNHWELAIQGGHDCLVQNNYVHDVEDFKPVGIDYPTSQHSHNSAGIMIFGSYTDGEVYNNTVEYNTVEGSYPDGSPNNVYSAYGEKSGYVSNTTWRYNFGKNCYTGFFGIANSADTNYNSNWSIYQNIIIGDIFFFSYDGSRDFSIYNNTFIGSQFLHKADYFINETVRDRNFKIFNNLFEAEYYIAQETSSPVWNTFLEYSDYNRAGISNAWGWTYGGSITTLANWRTTTGKDANSSNTSPNFINASGTTPESFKRTSYPEDGRGGKYPSVMGAYITGNETIGYTDESQSFDTTPPNAPVGLSVS